jgi:hypothetical protein
MIKTAAGGRGSKAESEERRRGSTPGILISGAKKGVRIGVSGLESTHTGRPAGVDSKGVGGEIAGEGLWLDGCGGAHKSEFLERGGDGRGRGGWYWEGPGVYCTVRGGVAKTQGMLPQEYTAVKDNLLMKTKGLGGGGAREGVVS